MLRPPAVVCRAASQGLRTLQPAAPAAPKTRTGSRRRERAAAARMRGMAKAIEGQSAQISCAALHACFAIPQQGKRARAAPDAAVHGCRSQSAAARVARCAAQGGVGSRYVVGVRRAGAPDRRRRAIVFI